MRHLTYRVTQHDGGWAYKQGDTFSETFPTHDRARAAAVVACREQGVPGALTYIEYQDATGEWITERADGHDRPDVDVQD